MTKKTNSSKKGIGGTFYVVTAVLIAMAALALAHILLEKSYFNRYFISIFIICAEIPCWIIIYVIIEKGYKTIFSQNLFKIFFETDEAAENQKEYEKSRQVIFGCHLRNFALHMLIWVMVCFAFLWMYGQGHIFVDLNEGVDEKGFFALGGFIFYIGSYAGVIMVNAIREANRFIKRKVRVGYFEDGYKDYIAIKNFFYLAVGIVYVVCLSLYLCVIAGPCAGETMPGDIIVFLGFLIVWPIAATMCIVQYLDAIKMKMKYYSIDRMQKNIEAEAMAPPAADAAWKNNRERIACKEYLLRVNLGEENYESKILILVTLVTGILQALSI